MLYYQGIQVYKYINCQNKQIIVNQLYTIKYFKPSMGYKLSETLTTKGYQTHLNNQNQSSSSQVYQDVSQTSVYKYLRKLMDTLKYINIFMKSNPQEIYRLFRCQQEDQRQTIRPRSSSNRQMFMLQMDRRISFNVGIKKNQQLRKQAMRCILRQEELQLMMDRNFQRDQRVLQDLTLHSDMFVLTDMFHNDNNNQGQGTTRFGRGNDNIQHILDTWRRQRNGTNNRITREFLLEQYIDRDGQQSQQQSEQDQQQLGERQQERRESQQQQQQSQPQPQQQPYSSSNQQLQNSFIDLSLLQQFEHASDQSSFYYDYSDQEQ